MILVFGKTGQVAIELQRQAPEAARLTALPRAQADLSDPAACAEAIRGDILQGIKQVTSTLSDAG